ncbi:MAG: hypothetical protein Q7J05_05995, partial [Paludibacter sp.]|nr:hypothetical protein [Paludibacter sp.]
MKSDTSYLRLVNAERCTSSDQNVIHRQDKTMYIVQYLLLEVWILRHDNKQTDSISVYDRVHQRRGCTWKVLMTGPICAPPLITTLASSIFRRKEAKGVNCNSI